MRRRRHRKLAPRPPVEYVTLAEVKQAGLTVSFDLLAAPDKQRICANTMKHLDDLPKMIREAIYNAAWDPSIPVQVEGGGRRRVNYAGLAVILIDNGHSSSQVVNQIERIDAMMTEQARQSGQLPPAGPA